MFKRILLKISGEALKTKEKIININIFKQLFKEIFNILKKDIELSIVIGGGNIFRGIQFKNLKIDRITGDKIGIISTIINSLALYSFLNKKKIKTYIMSSIKIDGICEIFNDKKAIKIIKKKKLIIFAGGIGNPLFTTDTASCIRAIETKSNLLIKMTNIDGVYLKNPNKILKKISYDEILNNNINIMDKSALYLAKENKLPIRIININKINNLYNIIINNNEGTLIE